MFNIRMNIRFKLLMMMISLTVMLVTVQALIEFSNKRDIFQRELDERIHLMKDNLLEKGKSLSYNLVGQIENDLAGYNLSNIQITLNKAIADMEEFKYAILVDRNGFIMNDTRHPEKQMEIYTQFNRIRQVIEENKLRVEEIYLEKKTYMEFVSPINISIEPWGGAIFGLSLEKLEKEIEKSQQNIKMQIRGMIFRTLLYSMIYILIGIAITTVLANRLSRPISSLTHTANQLSKGEFSAAQNLFVDSTDEIGILAQSFIDMAHSLEASYKQIEEYSHTLEQKVNERTQELVEALENLKKTQSYLVEAEKMASLGGLVAGVAHEINTPLGISVTAVTHLQGKNQEFSELYHSGRMKRSDFENYLELIAETMTIIFTNLNRAAELVQNFKQVSVDQSSEEKRIFNMKEYIEGVILSLRHQLKKTNHTIEIECSNSIEINSYPGTYSQILTNFIMNSLIHAFDKNETGIMRIYAEKKERSLMLVYSDNGAGMPENVVKHIFEPFFTTRRNQGGSGLGMHIVFNLVTQKLKGFISVESSPGTGTRFSIEVPD